MTIARIHRALVIALPALVLVQAALAGQHLFEGSSISLHGILGNVTFALAVIGVVLTVMRHGDGVAFSVAVALAALAFAQVGLGYVGRETTAAAAWHIPVGVTIFGLACFQLSELRRV
ncbi:MAG: hypothetical protein ACOYXM_13170 [Actinomycetota bacterium]